MEGNDIKNLRISNLKNIKDLENELERTFMKKNRSEWIEILDKAGVPCGPINKINFISKFQIIS